MGAESRERGLDVVIADEPIDVRLDVFARDRNLGRDHLQIQFLRQHLLYVTSDTLGKRSQAVLLSKLDRVLKMCVLDQAGTSTCQIAKGLDFSRPQDIAFLGRL